MEEAHLSLEEDELTGGWAVARKEVATRVSLQFPPYSSVVEMLQQSRHAPKVAIKTSVRKNATDGAEGTPVARGHRLLLEAAKRLMWLYHRHLPNLVEQSVQRVRTALAPFTAADDTKIWEGDHGQLDVLNQLHTFRLLGELENLTLSTKAGEYTPFSSSPMSVNLTRTS